MKIEKTSIMYVPDYLTIGLGIFSLIFAISPMYYTFGFSALHLFIFAFLLTLWNLYAFKIRSRINYLLITSFVLTTALVSSIAKSDIISLWAALNLIFGMSFYLSLDRISMEKVVFSATVILLFIILGGWITFYDISFGKGTIGQYTTITGKVIDRGIFSLFYPFWTPVGTFIRSAGIFDEPGAFSFVICSVAILRHSLKMDKRMTWILLSTGFITLSLAHFIYMIFHLLSERGFKLKLSILSSILVASFLLTISFPEVTPIFDRFGDRFEVNSNSERLIEGDNRSAYIFTNWDILSSGSLTDLFFGSQEGAVCCNPLQPLVERGLFGAWPYYAMLLIFFSFGVRFKEPALIGIALLFMQRPSIQSIGYSFLASAIMVSYLKYGRSSQSIMTFKSRVKSALG